MSSTLSSTTRRGAVFFMCLLFIPFATPINGASGITPGVEASAQENTKILHRHVCGSHHGKQDCSGDSGVCIYGSC
ncbi:MAG: hypothetical protein AAFY88_06860 [Acidobacteriota bacterium]